MKEWKIPVVWQTWATMKIEANSLAEAIEIAKRDETPIPHDRSWYVDDSFEIDLDGNVETIREMWNNGQEDEVDVHETCGDDRFEIIERAKADILDATNIDKSPEEMAVLDSFLYRCWQMRWLEKYKEND